MSGIFQITVAEARGFTAVSADLDRLAVVFGCSSTGSGLSPFYLSGASAVSALGVGDAVDTLAQIIEQRQSSGSSTKFPAAFYTTPVTTPGSYGTIDLSGVTGPGTVATHLATTPLGTYEARIKWIAGGTVGTAGMTIQTSLDGGRTYSNTVALGTATTYTIPSSGVQFDLSPSGTDLTALNTLINEIYTDQNAHVILTAGGVHGAADNADVVSIASATDTPTRIARINALRAAYQLHRVKTAGGVHGAADNTNALTAPAATDDSSALILALDLKAKYNAHRILTAGAVHGLADSTNATTSPAPAAGVFTAGDVAAVRTLAPTPSTSDVDAGFVTLANSTVDTALVVLDFPCDAAMAAHVTTGLNLCLAAGKRITAIVRTRLPDFEASESDTAWGTSIAADYAAFEDSRIVVRAAYNLQTDAMTTRQYLRSTLAQFAADAVRVGRFGWPCAPADRPEPNVTMVDADGATLGHDEGPRGEFTGLSNDTLGNRFSCEMRLPDPTRREDVYNALPFVMYAADERIRNMMVRRLANAMERVAVAAGTPKLGGKVFYVPTGPSSGTLTAASREALHGSIYQALATEFSTEISNAEDAALDSGLVQVSPTVTVSGGNLLGISITLAPRVAGFVLSISFVLSIIE